jgi:hypothetical protein
MSGRHKLLLFIPAIILIPIILGMPPLSMAHKLATGGPFTHCKQVQLRSHCLSHSLIPHQDPIVVTLDFTPLEQELNPPCDIQALDPDFNHSNITINFIPLRC